MIIQENEFSQPQINQIMFNIETKLSLLSSIQKSVLDNPNKQKHSSPLAQNITQNYQYQHQINLPMQILDQKMQSIINQKSPLSQKRNHNHNNKTFDKKKLQLNELQTATRNIDQIKRNPLNDLSNDTHNKQQKPQHQHVRQFTHQTEQSMSESMLESGSKSKSSSKIISKFNEIQLSYMGKIKSLSFKLSFLEQKLSQSQEQKQSLMESLETYKLLYSRKQQEIQKEMQKRLQEVKEKLIDKFAQQCRLKYNEYITELKQNNTQLNEQRKKRKFYEQQNKVFRLQKQNYEQMYKSLAKKQKLWLKLDIDHTKNQLLSNKSHLDLSAKQHCLYQDSSYLMAEKKFYNFPDSNQVEQYSHIRKLTNEDDTQLVDKENIIHNTRDHHHTDWQTQKVNQKYNIPKTNKSFSKSKQKSLSKSKDKSSSNNKKQPTSQKKNKSKSRSSTENQTLKQSGIKKSNKHKSKDQTNQMTKQELIPFLANGIQQLKQRLKMK